MGCGWTIYSYVFRKMMTSLSDKKYCPVYDSAAEAATTFKMLQFTCIGPFRRSRAHFEGVLSEIFFVAAQLRSCGSVRYETLVLEHKIMSEA